MERGAWPRRVAWAAWRRRFSNGRPTRKFPALGSLARHTHGIIPFVSGLSFRLAHILLHHPHAQMKFKGSLVDPTALLNVLSALEKLGTACIMNLSPTKIDFFMSKEFTKGDECFVDVTMSSVFENISISSLNDDQIPLHIDIGNLMRAIRSATSAVACTVKLTKKMAQPCLTFELQRSQHDHSITIQVCCLYPSRRSSVLFVISYRSACRVARVCACVGSRNVQDKIVTLSLPRRTCRSSSNRFAAWLKWPNPTCPRPMSKFSCPNCACWRESSTR